MIVDKQSSKYGAKRLSKIALVIVLPLLLVVGITWHVLRSDHAYVIRKVEEIALKDFDLNLSLAGYRLEWVRPFPRLRFHLNEVSIASKKHPGKPYIRINHANSEFNPWNILTGKFRMHPFHLDSAWIHIYTDSLDHVQKQQHKVAGKVEGLGIDLEVLPSFKVNYLDFHRENAHLKKSLWAKFSQFELVPSRDSADESGIQVQSNVFFEGLIFNPAAGGYLMDTPARINLNLYVKDEGRTLVWKHSTLNVGQNELMLSGRHLWADTNRLELQINTEQIMLQEVRQLLTQKLNNTLRDISVDQPVRASFALEKMMVPDWKDAIHLDFQTDSAEVRYQEVSMSSASLKGTYSSDCDQDGRGDPLTSCINFTYLNGNILGVLPVSLQGSINNMIVPHVEATGRMQVDLRQLNPLLAEKNKATFARGTAGMNFRYNGTLEELVDNPFDDQDNEVSGNAWFDQVTLATANHALTSPAISGFLSFDEDQTLLQDIDLSWMGSNMQLSGQIRNLPEFFFYQDQTLISDLELYFDELDLNDFKSQLKKNKDQVERPGKPMTGQRLETLIQQLAINLNGQLRLRADKLIYDTIYLTNFSSRIRLFSPRIEAYADSAMVTIDSLRANFMNRTPIYAEAEISNDPIPMLGIYLYLPKAVAPLNTLLAPKMSVRTGEASVDISGRTLLRNFNSSNDMLTKVQYRGQIRLEDITLEHSGFQQPIRHLSGPIIFDSQKATLDQLQFSYNDAAFTLNGNIRNYATTGEKAIIALELAGEAFDLNSANQTNASDNGQQKIISPPKLFRTLGKLYPYATGKLTLTIQDLLAGRQRIHPFYLRADLLPDPVDTMQYQLQVDSFNLSFGPENYFKGTATVKDPEQPAIEAIVDAHMELEQLGRLLPSDYVEMRSGNFTMDLRYQSPLYDTLNATNYLLKAQVDGQAELSDGDLFYNYRDFSFQHMSGRFKFDQRALYIQELDLEVNGNRLLAEGQSGDFFSFFVLPDQRANINLDVRSPRFDFGSFTAPNGLGKDTLRILRRADKLISRQIPELIPTDTSSALEDAVGYIDQLLNRGSIEMSTDFKEVLYEDFAAHQVDGRVSLTPDTVQLHNLQMNVADGRIAMAGLISNIVRHEPKIGISVHLDQNNVREIFRQFDNFGQRDLNYHNIEGTISADLNFQADVNSNYSILPESMDGDLHVKLVGGELLNLKLFNKLSGFLFRNRGMDHIILDTLQFSTHIRGSDLYIDHFHLHSSPFDFEAQGRYSLGAENNTRVLFSIPIGNLFNRHIPLKEMQQADSERRGLFNILIEARYKKGQMRFIWKPLVFSKKKYQMQEE